MVDLEAFTEDGFIKVEQAASRAVADAARAQLWHQLPVSPDDPATWTQPVRWAADLTGDGPLGELARSPRLAQALDAICGEGGWLPRGSLGNIPVRFPVSPPVDDRGWHIDLNTPGDDGTWLVSSRPRTVLALTLLSEVTLDDAPTRIRAGSHRDTARVLGDEPLSAEDAAALIEPAGGVAPGAPRHRHARRHVGPAPVHGARRRRTPRRHTMIHGAVPGDAERRRRDRRCRATVNTPKSPR